MSKKLFIVLAAFAALGLVLVACGGTAEPEVIEVTRVVTETVVETVEVGGEPVEVTRIVTETVVETVVQEVPAEEGATGECCDNYTIGIFEDPLTTNYWSYLGPNNSVWTAYIMDGVAPSLYTLSDQRFDFVPALAKDLPPEPEQEGDLYTITVEMLEGATWSDGEPITANDVAFTVNTSLDLVLTGNWPAIYRPEIIDSVEVIDDYTVKFYFTDIPGLAQWQYAAAQGPILPEHIWGPVVEEAKTFIADVTEPEMERPEDCEAEDLSDDDKAACEAWGTYDEAFENARETLYGAEAPSNVVGGGYTTDQFEPGAFVQRTMNENYFFAGAQIVESDDGQWMQTLADGTTRSYYGDGSGEVTLEYTGGPYSPNVIFSLYGDQSAAFLALANGEVDYVLNPLSLARGLREQAEQGEGVVTYTNPDNGLFYLAFNMRKEPYSLPEFRQAVDILTDKEFVADSVLQGSIDPTYSVVPPGNVFWFNDEVTSENIGLSRGERLDKAIQVLKDAGWTWETEPEWDRENDPNAENVVPGTGLRMPNGELMPETTILGPGPAYDPQRASFNQWISEWLREIGMPVQSELTGFNTILNPVFVDANFDMYILGWGLGIYPDYLCDFFHSANDTAVSGNYNTPGYNVPEYDALCDAFLAETNIEEAQAQAKELQAFLAKDLPYMPLFNRQSIDLINNRVVLPYTDTLGGIADANGMQVDAQVLK
ncbi:MAG TPA: ABC transporter substrate-binding protein [Anaerolineae bacterium]|nr:ABC transporter substrate-binding protein [Anaerolineae bacterium]